MSQEETDPTKQNNISSSVDDETVELNRAANQGWAPMPAPLPLPAGASLWQWIVTWLLLLGLAWIVIANNAGHKFPFLGSIFPTTEPAATESVATEPFATQSATTESVAIESSTAEPSATKPPTETPTPLFTDTPAITPVARPECSSLTKVSNFLDDNLSKIYFIIPRDKCIYLEDTGESHIANGDYIKVKVWAWVDNSIIDAGQKISLATKSIFFFDKPNGDDVPSSELMVEANLVDIEITGNTVDNFKEIIFTGWINKAYLKKLTPTPTLTLTPTPSQ